MKACDLLNLYSHSIPLLKSISLPSHASLSSLVFLPHFDPTGSQLKESMVRSASSSVPACLIILRGTRHNLVLGRKALCAVLDPDFNLNLKSSSLPSHYSHFILTSCRNLCAPTSGSCALHYTFPPSHPQSSRCFTSHGPPALPGSSASTTHSPLLRTGKTLMTRTRVWFRLDGHSRCIV